ncbi:MAG: nucleoside 2-deoxyribosyltransferase [candidate division Zixibacteria bacterium]|nr:nucleoside 2-deoxyribosyltransferase [candidate division Zixibacteria bacterium]MCK4427406.1 nucleoside 2-deoxyribosyltransferase [candidate division Zixibacteria bacterium]
MRKKIFVNAPLSTLAEQQLNKEITKIVKELGFEIYLPQEVIPPGTNASAKRVFEANLQAVKDGDIVLSVLDKPGLGVIFELAYALALKKSVILFRSDKQDYLGKIIEGLWGSFEEKNKAQTLEKLKKILKTYSGGEKQ